MHVVFYVFFLYVSVIDLKVVILIFDDFFFFILNFATNETFILH